MAHFSPIDPEEESRRWHEESFASGRAQPKEDSPWTATADFNMVEPNVSVSNTTRGMAYLGDIHLEWEIQKGKMVVTKLTDGRGERISNGQ